MIIVLWPPDRHRHWPIGISEINTIHNLDFNTLSIILNLIDLNLFLYGQICIITVRNEVEARCFYTCLSVICQTPPLGRQSTGQTHPPGRHPPWADTPWQTAPGQTTLTPGQSHPPWADTPGQTPPRQTAPGRHHPDRHHPPTATAADGTHPVGMLSC